MKNFTLLTILCFWTSFVFSQAEFNWEKTEFSPGHNLKKMAINGNSAVIAGYGNTFAKTEDGGDNWNFLDLFNPMFSFMDISVKGNVGYIVSNKEKLYDASPDVYASGIILKTTDAGATWEIIQASFGDSEDPAVNPGAEICHGIDFQSVETVNDSVAFCALRWYEYKNTGNDTHAGIFKTTDGGLTWMNVSGDLDSNVTTAIVTYGDEGFAGGRSHLYKISASADTLVDIFASLPGDGSDYIWDISIVDENEILLTTTSDSVYFSNDGGNTFDKFPGVKGGFDVMRVNDSTLVVGGGSNKSYASTDNGLTWNELGISTPIWEIGGIIADSINMLAKSAIYKCAVSDLVAGNYNFVKQNVGDGNLQKMHVNGTDVIVVGNDNNFFKSSDSGSTWQAVEIPEIPALTEFYDEVDFDGLSMIGDKGYAVFNRIKFVDYPSSSELDDIYWSGGIAYTDDNWETIKMLDVAKIGKENEDDPSINPNHDNCNGVNTKYIKCLCDEVVLLYVQWFDYTEDDRVEHSRVFKTIDAGKNWAAITEDLGSKYVQDIGCDGETLYIVGKELFLKASSPDLKSASNLIEFTDLYPVLDEGEDDGMFINSIWSEGNELFLTTSADSCYMSTDGGSSFTTMGSTKGSNDFYRFDANSFIIMGSSGKSKFTNDGGESWIDCHPGATTYSIGGELNGKFYALGQGAFYTTSVEDLALKVSARELTLENKINIIYHPESVVLVSSEKEINRCDIYSLTGRKVSSHQPNSRTFRIYNKQFNAGIYMVKTEINGEINTEKILIK